MKTLTKAQQFFYDNIGQTGWTYHPATESPDEGRINTAIALASAEEWAMAEGVSFQWCVDPLYNSSDYSDENPPWELWFCVAYDAEGNVLDRLGGVDFGRDGTPWGDNYRRVVEAEIAAGAML